MRNRRAPRIEADDPGDTGLVRTGSRSSRPSEPPVELATELAELIDDPQGTVPLLLFLDQKRHVFPTPTVRRSVRGLSGLGVGTRGSDSEDGDDCEHEVAERRHLWGNDGEWRPNAGDDRARPRVDLISGRRPKLPARRRHPLR